MVIFIDVLLMAALVFAALVAGWITFTGLLSKRGKDRRFGPFMALRYLKPKRSFVSVITLISVLGVGLGVMIIVVVIAVFAGYGERIKESILGFEPHIYLDSNGILEDWEEVVEKVESVPGIVSVIPVVQGQVLLDFRGHRLAPKIRSIPQPEEDSPEYARLKSMITEGEFYLDLDTVVIGDDLAGGMGIGVGDVVTVHSAHNIDSILDAIEKAEEAKTEEERNNWLDKVKELTFPHELTVTGIFNSGNLDFDGDVMFVHLETGQTLYQLRPGVHGIAIRTEDAFQASQFREDIQLAFGAQAIANTPGWPLYLKAGLVLLAGLIWAGAAFGWIPFLRNQVFWIAIVCGLTLVFSGLMLVKDLFVLQEIEVFGGEYRTLTWMEMHRFLFEAVAAERQAMYFVLLFLMIVAGFCITNTMITVVFQKRTEIGLLKAVGATEKQISQVFLFQGFVIGTIGVLVGLLFAWGIIEYRKPITTLLGYMFHIDLFSKEQYRIDGGLPAKVEMRDVLLTSVGALIACVIASTAPARMAARLEPAKALRSE